MAVGSSGWSRGSRLAEPMASTTSMPDFTEPKIVYFLGSRPPERSARQMKF